MSRTRGFSIIEVMLVLSIILVLFVAMMATVHISISRQSYEDSLTSFRDFLQRQYSEVQNVTLDEGVSNHIKECDSDDVRGKNRGRTDCYVIGRLLKFTNIDDTSVINVEQIVYNSTNTSSRDELIYNDFQLGEKGLLGGIKTYGHQIDRYQVEWTARLYTPKSSGVEPQEIDNNLSIFIFRSPESGTVRTYVQQGAEQFEANQLAKMLTEDNLNKGTELCVIPDGSAYTDLRAVRVLPGASTASNIEIPLPDEVKCAKPTK